MKDSDLHNSPEQYWTTYGHSAAQEASGGTTEALEGKLRYIDDSIAESERAVEWSRDNGSLSSPIAMLDIQILERWYSIIEAELEIRWTRGERYEQW